MNKYWVGANFWVGDNLGLGVVPGMFGVLKFVFNILFDFMLPKSHFSLDTELPHPKPLTDSDQRSSDSLPNNPSPVGPDPVKVCLVG